MPATLFESNWLEVDLALKTLPKCCRLDSGHSIQRGHSTSKYVSCLCRKCCVLEHSVTVSIIESRNEPRECEFHSQQVPKVLKNLKMLGMFWEANAIPRSQVIKSDERNMSAQILFTAGPVQKRIWPQQQGAHNWRLGMLGSLLPLHFCIQMQRMQFRRRLWPVLWFFLVIFLHIPLQFLDDWSDTYRRDHDFEATSTSWQKSNAQSYEWASNTRFTQFHSWLCKALRTLSLIAVGRILLLWEPRFWVQQAGNKCTGL